MRQMLRRVRYKDRCEASWSPSASNPSILVVCDLPNGLDRPVRFADAETLMQQSALIWRVVVLRLREARWAYQPSHPHVAIFGEPFCQRAWSPGWSATTLVLVAKVRA